VRWLFLFMLACHGSESAPTKGSGSALASQQPTAETFDICKVGTDQLAKLACKTPEDARQVMQARSAIEGLIDAARKTPSTDPKQFQVMCAQLVQAIDRDAVRLGCGPRLDDATRLRITGVLDAFYSQRTKVVPTGDPAADAAVKRVAAVRDAACACADLPCLDKLGPQLDEAIAQLPPKAKELANKLLDDAGRCATRLRSR